MTPTQTVQGQLEAYNARDLTRFLTHFAEGVCVYRMPTNEAALVGKTQLAGFYATERFNKPALHAELLARIALGNTVIDHERIHGVREQAFEIAVAYEVQDGKILRLWTF